jgi:tellurite resistance-related uncharacterized protein
MAARAIRRFHRDEEGHWVADLSCGHTRHVRHRPPWENRPWVESEEGRASMLGVELECSFCDMPSLPPDVEVYRRTPTFDASSVPRGLLEAHTTKAGTWGRIVVEDGRLRYELLEPEPNVWVLRAGVPGIVPPERKHRVAAIGAVRFYVEFLRAP